MIRPVTSEDASAIKEICECSLGHPQSEGYISERILRLSADSNYFIHVYEDDRTGQILGFIQAERYGLLYGGDGWNIIAFAVSPTAGRRGIGRKLLEVLEETALKEGSSFIRLNCNVNRTDAHGFYEHMGYSCDKTQKRFIKYIMKNSGENTFPASSEAFEKMIKRDMATESYTDENGNGHLLLTNLKAGNYIIDGNMAIRHLQIRLICFHQG